MTVNGPVQRWLAALLGVTLLSIAGLEPVLGSIRDGQLHHESAATSAENVASSHGDQGNDDGGALPEHERDNGHQHGTSADHCTHAHGPVAVTELRFEFRDVTSRERHFVAMPLAVDRFIEVATHPPKA